MSLSVDLAMNCAKKVLPINCSYNRRPQIACNHLSSYNATGAACTGGVRQPTNFRRIIFNVFKQMPKVIWQKATSLTCHPSRWRIYSSAASAGQAHSPWPGDEQCAVQSCVNIILQWAGICPGKSAPSRGGFGSPSNLCFHGLTRVFFPNGISIGSAVFAQLTRVPNTQTDR